jgi:hypothetical protein
MVRGALLALVVVLLAPASARAEWQLKPFLGVTFGGDSSFVLSGNAGHLKPAVGAGVVYLGNVFGAEAEVSHVSRFFAPSDSPLVLHSGLTTATASVMVAVPGRLVQYSLRPYVVAGGGLMRARIDDALGLFNVASTLPTMDVGGGVTGFLTDVFGVSWDVRYFRSIRGREGARGVSLGAERVSFWRANMALAVRF